MGCGECLTACYGGERVITIVELKVTIGKRCLGWDMCVEACPIGVISVLIDPQVDFIESLVEKSNQRVYICSQ